MKNPVRHSSRVSFISFIIFALALFIVVSSSKVFSATHDYDFNSCTYQYDCDVMAYDVDQFPFGGNQGNRNSADTPTSGEVTYMSFSNNTRWTTVDPGRSDEILFWTEFNISETITAITEIQVTFEGYLLNSTANFSVWAFRDGGSWEADTSWDQLGSTVSVPTGSDTVIDRTISSGFSDYINASTGLFRFVVSEDISTQSMRADYIRVRVTYNESPSATLDSAAQTSTDGSGEITIQYDLSDAESDVSTFLVEYSYDNSNWYQAWIQSSTAGSVDNTGVSSGTSSGQITGIASTQTNATFIWNTQNASNQNGAFSGNDSAVWIRITPSDAYSSGSTVTSSSFAVANQPPSQSNWSPAKSSTIGSTSQTILFDLDNAGDCKWSLSDQAYSDMTGDCSGDGTTSISCAVTGLSEGAVTVYTACKDIYGNEDTAATNEAINYTLVMAPPVQSNWSPAKGVTVTSANFTISLDLNENGDCRWSLSDLGYDSMSGDCSGDGGTSIYCPVENLSEGSEIVYIACNDSDGTYDTASTNEHVNYTVDTSQSSSDWWNTSWKFRIPLTITKPSGYESAKYSKKLVDYTLDFSSIGVDAVDENSIRVTRFNGSTWADIPSQTSGWTDQGGASGYDLANIVFFVDSNDLTATGGSSVQYFIYFDIDANGPKSAPSYSSLVTLKILCFDNDNESQLCEEITTYTSIGDYSLNVSESSTLTDLAYSNLITYDQVYFGWNAVSNDNTYQFEGYETDIKNYVYYGGRILTAASDNSGWNSGWLPDPGSMWVADSGDSTGYPTEYSPFDSTIFDYPNSNALPGITEDEDFRDVPAGYDIMAQDSYSATRKFYLRKFWGSGVYLLSSMDTRTTTLTTAASGYIKNSIYWGVQWTEQAPLVSIGTFERYRVFDANIYQSDYSTALDSAQVGETIYIEVNSDDYDPSNLGAMPVLVTSDSDSTGITVSLIETAVNSGEFRGTALLSTSSDGMTDKINTDSLETVTITPDTFSKASDSLTISYSDPNNFTSIDFKSDNTYATSLSESVSVGAILYIEVVANDTNSLSTDRVNVTLTSGLDPTGISVALVETGRNTGIFRGTAVVAENSNDTQDYIGAFDADTVTAQIDLAPSLTDDAIIATTPPASVTSISIYESDYSTSKTEAAGGETIYIELIGVDGNPYGSDSTAATVFSSVTAPTGIQVQLTETSFNSGKYRGTATLGATTDAPTGVIGAMKVGETVTAESTLDDTKYDSVTVSNTEPTSISSVVLKTNSAYTTDLTTGLTVGSTLYIQLTAGDLNNQTRDTTDVTISSTETDPTGITVTLVESGPNTGIFRGTAVLKPASNQSAGQIGADNGETVTIASDVTPSKSDTVAIISSSPETIASLTFMADATYSTALTSSAWVGSPLYIQIEATDLNPESSDSTIISVYSTSDPTGISVTLRESGVNTGLFNGEAFIKSFTDDTQNYIKGVEDDTVTAESDTNNQKKDTVTVTGVPPKGIFNLALYESDYTTSLTQVYGGDIIYIEATGVDGNTSSSTDLTTVRVTSTSDPTGITVTLNEYGGTEFAAIFRGTVTARNASNQASGYIKIVDGDTVTVTSDNFAAFENGSNEIWVECEDANVFTPNMTANIGSGTSGGEYVYVPQGSYTGSAEYVLYKSTPGTQTYYTYGRLYPEDTGGDQFYSRMDNSAEVWFYADGTIDTWADPWNDGQAYSLSQGAHVFRIRNTSESDDATRCDKLVFKQATGAPSGYGSDQVLTYPSGNLSALETNPTTITSVDLKTNSSYSTTLSTDIESGNTLYIELVAVDGNQYTVDTTTVSIVSSITDPTGINVTLTETGIATGIFRGTASVAATSDDGTDQIGAATNEIITITSDTDGSKLDTVTVDTPAVLSIDTVTSVLTEASQGQNDITITFTVDNLGSAEANVSSASLTFTNNGDFTVTPDAGNPTQIAGNASDIVFTFTVDVSGSASTAVNTIDASITASDALTSADASDSGAVTTDSLEIVAAAALGLTLSASPSQVIPGQTITLTMTVTNSGSASAVSVTPSSITVDGTSTATLISGPAPASADISGGGNQDFTWTYAAGSAGTVFFTGSASGSDSNSGNPVQSDEDTTPDISIASEASMASTIDASPSIVNFGGTITVTLSVENTGGTTINSVTPTEPVLGGTSSATKLSGPTPSSADLSAGADQDFVWTYEADSLAGSLNFSAYAEGTDQISGNPVSSTNDTSSDISVQMGCALESSITSAPATVSTGQNITVSMSVNNTGDSNCSTVTPSALTKGGTSNATLISGPSPTSASISGGGNQVFSWTFSASATSGTVNFTGNVSGSDSVSGSPISSSSNTSNDTTIEQRAALDSSLTGTPSNVSSGQEVYITMTVVNSGESDATGVMPSDFYIYGTSGEADWVSGPTPASADITGGGQQQFSWVYTAGSTAGTLKFQGNATGTDSNSSDMVSSEVNRTNTINVVAAADISATITVSPSTVSYGQAITVTMTVNNTGGAAANTVTPSSLTLGGTSGDATLASGPSPASANISGGGSQNFTWTYTTGSTSGTLDFTGSASGEDANSSDPVSTGSETSPSITVQSPSQLTAAMDSTPDNLGVGDDITVTLTITNTGEATALTVTPSSIALGGDGAALYVSGPSPASANITGGGNQIFTWMYDASEVGSINFTASASGYDANDSSPVSSGNDSSEDDVITENPDAVLSSTIAMSPTAINTGSNITVTMTVTNVGNSGASNVTPSALTLGGTGSGTYVSGPSPSSGSISPDGSLQFTWTYTAASAGTINFTGYATGDNDGLPPPDTVTSDESASSDGVISDPAALTSSISIPSSVNTDQDLTVTMTVQNTGGTSANSVTPSSLTIGGTSGASLVSGPAPASATISGGGSQNFTWTYTASSTPGTLDFTGNASGTDNNSGGSVSSTSTTSNSATVQESAALSASMSASPATVSGNQDITVTLTVNNTGDSAALGVAPTGFTLGGTGSASYSDGPSPASADISGGGSQDFVWTYIANNSNGTVNFTAGAAGTDASDSSPVSATPQTSSDVTVQKKAVLTSSILGVPGTVSSGQQISITMTVNNTGTATANAVIPSSLTISGTSGDASIVSGPSPSSASISGGGSQNFTWVYQAGTTTGTLILSGNASGSDANSGVSVSSTSNQSNTINIYSGAALTSSITASPSSVSNGQNISVTMTVNNTGDVDATSVAPSSLVIGGTAADATLSSGPTPSSASIVAGGNQDFTWTYVAGNTDGTVNFTGNASGSDYNSGQSVSSTSSTSNDVTVIQAAVLSSTIIVTPSTVSPGGSVQVTMKVTNSGGAIAQWVIPSSLTIGGSSTANYSSGPQPGALNQIASGNTRSFTWVYIAGTTIGTLNFSGNAAGTDANSGGQVSSTSTTSNTIAVNPLSTVWTYPSSGSIGAVRSSASVRNNVVYIGSDDDYLYSLNATNGALRWRHYSRDDVVSWPLIIDWGTKLVVYYGSMGNYVYAVRDNGVSADTTDWATDGKNVGNRIVSTTVSDNIRLYFGCYDDKVHALDITDGSSLWTSQTLGGDLISSPSVFGTELYIGSTDNKIYALNVADGTYLRDFDTGGSVEGLPWVDQNGVLFIGSSSGKFYSLNASNLSQNWVYPSSGSIGSIISSPWVEPPRVYFGSNDGKLYCLNVSDGLPCTGFTPYQTGGSVRSSPLVWDGVVYFGSDDDKFYAINALTGALLTDWPYETGGDVYSSPSLDWENNRIIIGSDSGKIFCFDALVSGQ